MLKKAKKGFTIVELVIVIAVIGILSAILIPTFANLTTQAQDTALKSNLANAYASYASTAADGQLDEEALKDVKIKFVAEKEVYLCATNDLTKGYQCKADGWDIKNLVTMSEVASATQVVVAGTYGAVDVTAEQATQYSTFNGYVVFYSAA